MPRLIAVVLITAIMTLLFPSAVLTPLASSQPQTENVDLIFEDIIADYALFTAMLNQTYFFKQYQILTCVDNTDAAVEYLAQGFSLPLAQALVDYYLLWLPELGKMAVIPTDSIPVITNGDKPYMNIRRISPDEVVLERIYTNCYEMGDRYFYGITAHKEKSRWIIVDLNLESLPDEKNDRR